MVKIGLEIHAYLNTKEKLFCNCSSEHGIKFSKPNTNICPVCTGQPGAKPMLPNKSAVDKVIQIALILGCKVNETLIWQRKHYSWPDLPKGYQNTISGPYATENGVGGNFFGIGITEVHLEEDPAAWNPETGRVDYNRSGIPLIEIVTEPDFKSIEEVSAWLKKLISTLNYIKAVDRSLGIKADVNVSTGGARVEIKNINSIKNIELALKYEIDRQKKEPVKIQHTRMFDSQKNVTILMRTKEQAEDYRFISDPDLPSLKISKERVSEVKKELPETPEEKLKKFIKDYKIEKKYAEVLIKKLDLVEFVEKVIGKVNLKLAIPWITIELLGALNHSKKELDEVEINPEHFIELLKLLEKKEITELKAQEILRKFIPKSFSPREEAKKHSKISDSSELEKIVQEIIKNNSKAVEDYKKGKKESLNFLIGQVMKLSNKRADFKTAKEFLENILG
jgi:aspartyl-tRNA(Asn)/glutamyl-tRNA(Gln) amidotransferase subunit B